MRRGFCLITLHQFTNISAMMRRNLQHVVKSEISSAASGGAAEVFRCEYEGSIGGFLSEVSIFRLRVLDDATLEGHVLQKRTDTTPSSRHPAKMKRRKLTTRMASKATEKRSDTGGSDDTGDGALVVCGYVHGRARSIGAPLVASEPLRYGDEYCCYIDISREKHETDQETITCHAHFIPKSGALVGCWVMHHEKPFWITVDTPCELYDQELKQRFKLQRIDIAHHPHEHEEAVAKQELREDNKHKQEEDGSLPLKLYPLTPGLYEFRGFTTTASLPRQSFSSPSSTSPSTTPRRRRGRPRAVSVATKDECFVTLRLLPDGTLKGTSRELAHPQSCPVHGTWRIDRVRYILEYKVRGAVGLFRYSGRVDGAAKIHGRWRNVDEGHQEGYDGGKGDFELEVTQAVRHSVVKREDHGKVIVVADDEEVNATMNNKIRVLTTGVYKLKGCATDDDGYEYGCELSVQLLPSGYLRGTSRELIFDQTRPIFGLWSPRNLSYQQDYVVKGDVGSYCYSGVVDFDGGVISGEWENVEEQDKDSRGERGTFAYGITEAQRLWTTYSHVRYPRPFRDGVFLVLLCSSRTHALPCSLWCRVFEYCHESWLPGAK